MKEYMTVKDYAAASGMSHQAVYKSIKAGKLVTKESTIDGKTIKMIVVDDNHMRPSPAVLDPVLLDTVDANPDRQDDAAVIHGPEDPANNDGTKALEKAIEALTQQLAEKDRQIADLMKLLHNQQELQAHSQLLLSQPATEEKTDTVIPETPPAEKPKRRRFWDWWTS